MDPFKSCQRWCRTLLNRRGALTKPPFCDSPLTGCELTMVSALYLLEFDSFAVNDCKRDNKTCNLLRQSISFKLFFCFAKHLKQIKKFPSNSFLFISFLQAEFSYSRFIFVFRHTVLGRNEACDSRSRWIWKTIWVWCSDGMSRLVLFFFYFKLDRFFLIFIAVFGNQKSNRYLINPKSTEGLMKLLDTFLLSITCRGNIVLISNSVEQYLGHCRVGRRWALSMKSNPRHLSKHHDLFVLKSAFRSLGKFFQRTRKTFLTTVTYLCANNVKLSAAFVLAP